MKNIKQAFLSGLVFLGTVIIGFIGFATYTSLPTQIDGTTITKDIWNNLINKVNDIGTQVDSMTGSQLGVGQTRQDLTSSKALNTLYTNNSGKSIIVSVGSYTTIGVYNLKIQVSIDSGTPVTFGIDSTPTGWTSPSGNFVVPNGSTYKVTTNSATTLNYWSELR